MNIFSLRSIVQEVQKLQASVTQLGKDLLLKANTTTPAWVNATLTNSYVSYTGETVRYRKDNFNRLWIQGTVTARGLNDQTVFTLPTGYRPTKLMRLPSLTGNGACRIEITTAGLVIIRAGGEGTGNLIPLNLFAIPLD